LPKITILIGFSFVELSTVDSTNNYAMALVHEGLASHGRAIFAHEQTAGKGQRGKTWSTEPESNIILSVLVDPRPIRHFPTFTLSAATALAASDLFRRHAPEGTLIKWPNDIYWGDRKAGGILIENVYRGKEWQWSVLGIGMNINQIQFPEGMGRPVSLRQITGNTYDAKGLAMELCALLEERWQQLCAGVPILREYESLLLGMGRLVRLRAGNLDLETLVLGVAPDGRLQTEAGLFSVGEIEWLW
jgi:BirA family biotin operon repressor/biotin-[acetyl-CoA-carboxylase] ligase